MSYVYERSNGLFEIRYPIPSDVVSYFPKPNSKRFRTHIIKSLSTRDQNDANKAAIDCIKEFEGAFSVLREGVAAVVVPGVAPNSIAMGKQMDAAMSI